MRLDKVREPPSIWENHNADVEAAVAQSLSRALPIDAEDITVRIAKLNNSGVEQYQINDLSDNERGDPVRVTVTVDYAEFNPPSNFLRIAPSTISSSAVMRRIK